MMSLRPPALFLLLAAETLGYASQEPGPRPAAAPPEIGATVQFAPGGDLCGPWQAFSVEVDSRTTRDLELLIRIEDDAFSGIALRRERLSPGGRKRVFLYSPGGGYPRSLPPRYRITDASDRELAAGLLPVTPRGYVPRQYQIGLFSRTAATEEDFGIPSSINGQELRLARISTDTLPDRWAGLASLDLLVIHDAPLDELTADQARALADYVRQGGSVLLSPGATKGWLTHPVLAAFAPLRVGPPHSATSVPGLNRAYGAFRGPEPFLVHELLDGQPFNAATGQDLVRLSSGFGRVFATGCDLRRAPFDTWAGRRALWTDLVTASPRWFQESRSTFPCAASSRQRFELFLAMARLINPYPSFGLILGLAVVFLAVVGPLNYFLLWRLRRTLLLVVTVPAISIGFLALILVLGYVLKGTTTVVHSARLLSTQSGLDCAREIQLYSLFSPSTRTYDVSCEPGTFGEPPARWSPADEHTYTRENSLTTLTCETGAGLTLRGLGAGQWQSWDLETRSIAELGKGVSFDVEGAGLRVQNNSARVIERGIYVQTGREPCVVPFGEIAAGGRAEAVVLPGAPDPVRALGFDPDSLGDRILRPWFAMTVRPLRVGETVETARRFLICVMRDERRPVQVDARISDRSRSLTLLHVAEAP
ncbi:MAG TPA: hypothetical protein VNM14_20080 [Planctomycetota bacterium]|nr:hypothetical protein [Planctomycetota bacterium]